MLTIRKILFPTDFSDTSERALNYALFLAHQYGAELHLLHVEVLYDEDPHNPKRHFPDTETILERLRALTRNNDAGGQLPEGAVDRLDIRYAHRRNISAAPAIVEYAAEEAIDLIVMGTHGRRGLRRLLLGSVAEEVVRTAPCPVLTVRARRDEDTPRPVRHILVPIDFSQHAREALTVAREIAAQYGARLQLLHVLEEVLHPAFYNFGATSLKDLMPDIEEKATEAMKKFFRETPGAEVEASYHVIEGHAGRDIAAFAEKHASDLIVISTHGLTGLEHLLLGSVTEKVVRRAPCPVLVVKAFRRSIVPSGTG
ncbi:MAG: universal stress protein [Rhodothermaceae bacterium]|nr:MAG: universal stress protein [Rhodothermaceae bacterium]